MNVTNNLNIDWDEIDSKFKFAAMCARGAVWIYTECPIAVEYKNIKGFWRLPSVTDSIELYSLDGKSILKEPVHWKDTLTARPVKVE